jgi:glycosyltransferase involved in cell wall biosynthesis
VALIVQRYGTEVVGGSETLARQYARILKDRCQVEVLTTCALDHQSWANHYRPGHTVLEGIPLRRFANDFERGPDWQKLVEILLGPMDPRAFPDSPILKQNHAERMAAWPRALQEEIIHRQGPYSAALLKYLSKHKRDYDVFVFFAYLFPTSYFGMRLVPRERVLFCPTLHDEPIAYLPIFRRSFQRPRLTLFLTESERALARRLYGGAGRSDVVGMALATPARVGPPPPGTPPLYVLYAGRIEGSKGTDALFEYFSAYKRRYPSDLKLVLIGTISGPWPRRPDVLHLGFVGEAEKFALMERASALIQPSPYESFSIVLLESFLMGTPALVNESSEVLMEHCRQSGAGLGFASAGDFSQALQYLLADDARRSQMGERGRHYVEEKFSAQSVTERLWQAVEQVGSPLASGEGMAGVPLTTPLRR